MAEMKPRRLKGHKRAVTCCIASRSCPGIIASAGEDGCICWYDLRRKDVLFTMDVGKNPVSSICFKAGNEDVIYASSGTEVISFDIHMASSWKRLESYNYNKEEINQIAVSPLSSFLAVADDSGDIKIIDTQQHSLYKTLRAVHTNICSSVQFLSWKPWSAITGGLDSKLVMWDFSKGRPFRVIDFGKPSFDGQEPFNNHGQCFNPAFVHSLAVPEVDMFPELNKACVVGRGDGVVDVIDIESELSATKFSDSSKSLKGSLSRSKGAKAPLSDSSANRQGLGKRLQLDYTLGGHTAAVSCVSFSSFAGRGRFIISGGNDSHVKVWDLSNGFGAGEKSCNRVLNMSTNVGKKVNWLCSTPTNSENLIVCDTSKVMKVYTVSD